MSDSWRGSFVALVLYVNVEWSKLVQGSPSNCRRQSAEHDTVRVLTVYEHRVRSILIYKSVLMNHLMSTYHSTIPILQYLLTNDHNPPNPRHHQRRIISNMFHNSPYRRPNPLAMPTAPQEILRKYTDERSKHYPHSQPAHDKPPLSRRAAFPLPKTCDEPDEQNGSEGE